MGIYLDYNATTKADSRVLAKMMPVFEQEYGNASSRDHCFGWSASEAVEEARVQVGRLIGAESEEIIFTSGATESINLALRGIKYCSKRSVLLTTLSEHSAVLDVGRYVEQRSNASVQYLKLSRTGRFDVEELRKRCSTSNIAAFSIMLANNEIGSLHDISAVAELLHPTGAIFFSDLTQAVGKIEIDVKRLNLDMAAFSAHKLYGPKGIGALYVSSKILTSELTPLIVGGSQEKGVRAGTLNVPAIVGFGEACRIAREEMPHESVRIQRLRDRLESSLTNDLQDIFINGDLASRLPNTSSVCFVGVDARTLIRDMHDIAVSTKSACSSGNSRPSHVLKAIGLTDDEAYSCIRFSLGRFTSEEEIDYAIGKVIASVAKLRRMFH